MSLRGRIIVAIWNADAVLTVHVRWWGPLRDWCESLIFHRHNARVIADFERRMALVLMEATGGQMSKPYYDADTMIGVIRSHVHDCCDEALQEELSGYSGGDAA